MTKREVEECRLQYFKSLYFATSTVLPLTSSPDIVKWDDKEKGEFSTKEMYLSIDDSGVRNDFFKEIWKMKIPLKIKIFLWLLSKRRLLTRMALSARGWDGDKSCVYCGTNESVDHLFFRCTQHRNLWDWFLNQFQIRRPRDLEELL
ncbi:hypothetical protein LUZ61_011662 [Rhynchospora tenuis]|uniref:Reverse transcriptase zinc-binding domain-containing protein n=1 Tax=Rhynchospora tenuis TaxID=198213 RepID=A0AAD6A1H0_9POAL|nr:hypothetical protein LUZ61_011662 [Rhynchospora tenuis]